MYLCQVVRTRVCLCVSESKNVSNEVVKLLKMIKSYILTFQPYGLRTAFLKPSIVLYMYLVNSEFNSDDQQLPIATKRKKKKKEQKLHIFINHWAQKNQIKWRRKSKSYIPNSQTITGIKSRITYHKRLVYITEYVLVVPELSFLLDLSPNRWRLCFVTGQL